MADPVSSSDDYRLCSGGYATGDGQVRCEHGVVGPHRTSVNSSDEAVEAARRNLVWRIAAGSGEDDGAANADRSQAEARLSVFEEAIAARVRAEAVAGERQRIERELIRRAEAADRADLASIGDVLDDSQCRHVHRAETYRAAARAVSRG